MRLTSSNLAIRPLAPDDEGPYCRLISDPAVSGRLVGAFGPNGEIRLISDLDGAELAEMFRARLEETIAGSASRYAVLLRDTGALIGSIGSYPIDDERIGLSFWIAGERQGRGLGTEALCAYCRPALGLFCMRRMLANVAVDNAASLKALRKAGFRDFDASASPGVTVPAGRVFLQLDAVPALLQPAGERTTVLPAKGC